MTGGARLPIGLAAYSFGYLGGFVGAGTPRACPDPFDAYSLIDLAVAHDLGGVEFPATRYLANLSSAELTKARDYAALHNLFIVLDGGIVDAAELQILLPAAREIGARTVRATVSSLLCGDRREVRETWPDYLAEIAARLRQVRGLAEQTGVSIALENHQDLTSGELVALCEDLGSPFIGVNLDASNPLAVGEDPLNFARRILPYLKNVHLKDYYLYSTQQGFRLVRCPVGAGVLDVPGLLALCADGAPQATISIELGWLQERHIRLLEDDFWPGYPPRPIEELLPVLRLREAKARPKSEHWRTPWERGEQGAALAGYEMSQFEDSVAYLKTLARGR